MTPAKENLAYDFSLFEEKDNREEEENARKPRRAKPAAQAKKKINAAGAVRWAAVCLFITLALVAVMVCNVQLNRLNDEISKTQTQLAAQQSEQVRLNVELESRSSLSSVEDYAANQAGMQKSSQYQVTYVHLTDQDKVELAPKNSNIFTKFINFILEYL